MAKQSQKDKDNLIIGMLVKIQAETQLTRDILISMIADVSKMSEEKLDAYQKAYNAKIDDYSMAIIASIKLKHLSKQESIDEMLNNLFGESPEE